MPTRKHNKAKHKSLFKQIWKLFSTTSKQLIEWFLRSVFVITRQIPRQQRFSRSGFVLPTAVMLLLILSLVVAALLARTTNRVNQVLAARQENYISNAASPAIERAKAKVEFLFSNPNSRLPNGVPGQTDLAVLLNGNEYNFAGETRIDLNNNNQADNAWVFPADIDGGDTNGDGNPDNDPGDATIAYSIITQTPNNQNTLNDQSSPTIRNRARNLEVRNGVVFDAATGNCASVQRQDEGWFVSSTNNTLLRKNFQINAVVIPNGNNLNNTTFSTLELQQDRQLNRGNKWGAWFRYDINIFNTPPFNWNGAIHTEGNIFIGGNNNFAAYLLSSPNACAFNRNASEITLAEVRNPQTNQILFQGQVVNGSVPSNQMLNNTIGVHYIDQNKQVVSTGGSTTFNGERDSIAANANLLPGNLILDPLAIFTQETSRSVNVPNWNNVRDSNWENREFVSNQRIRNQQQPRPYVDDTYRADNRYGPKPSYGREGDNNRRIPAGRRVGDDIIVGPGANNDFVNQLTSNAPINTNQENVGLDGYWERRARRDGLRLIVGERLELGNLMPQPTITITHEAKQRRTLRDNVAAVQAAAIYHQANRNAAGNIQDFPVACLSTTVHPGTAETLKRSSTFDRVQFTKPGGELEDITYSDFFYGWGTNGWEYAVPDAATFPRPEMLRALNNLANFAGDPFGAFPAQQDNSLGSVVPAAGRVIHPLPQLTQYGNFSNLRRAIRNLNAIGYANLSIADQSYLHTAGCTLGILANNIKVLQDFSYARNILLLAALNVEIADLGISPGATPTPEEVIGRFAADQNMQRLARAVYLKEQVEVDRRNGGNYVCAASTINFGPGVANNLFRLCPMRGGAAYVVGTQYTAADVRYRALYYIFPATQHDETEAARTGDAYIRALPVNPPTPNLYRPIEVNTTNVYNAATDAVALERIRLRPRRIAGEANINQIEPLWTLPALLVNNPDANAPNDRLNSLIRYRDSITGNQRVYRVPFKDAALFNGREMMSVRVLDIDLDLLRRNNIGAAPNLDYWLPQRSIIYAFREDAVREDGIARPNTRTWANCNTVANITTANCRMNAVDVPTQNQQDPPLNIDNDPNTTTDNGISTKPVDFYPDPDRRPYGFRLRNGVDLTRVGLNLNDDNNRGMSFISDNPVYIQGNFNFHSTDGTNSNLEEFTQALQDNYGNFYTRNTKETRFANAAQDRWRSTEIITDAVTILSSNFCDGSIEDGFITAGAASNAATVGLAQYACGNNNGRTSYLNQNLLLDAPAGGGWRRENTFDNSSPIRVHENGNPVMGNGNPYSVDRYYGFNNLRSLIGAAPTRVNAIIVSGAVPSRANSYNGGLHNFPRFIENWTDVPLRIAGSLIQLNFSTYATAPWEHDAWEPANGVQATEIYRYYTPPNRLWGYDVALQLAPAGSVARRFIAVNPNRSEYYRELPIDDPYILNLRCARRVGDPNRLDSSVPNASCQ